MAAAVQQAGGIELSLEENRAERGNIGYIDMKRLFQLFPETLRAKENFEEVVRQAEEQINLRKAEVLRLRAELTSLKGERETLAKAPPPPEPAPVQVSTQAAKEPAPEQVPPQPVKPALEAVLSTTTTSLAAKKPAAPADGPSATIATLPGFGPASLPGSTTAAAAIEPPAGEAARPEQAAAIAETPPLAAEVKPPPPPAVPAGPTAAERHAAALRVLDEQIAEKERLLAQKQVETKDHQAAAEKNLLDLESRKSEILLGRIYKAVQDVARKEGVSVVVDKGSILYGHNAVDLTDKVLKFLKGA